MSGPYDALQKIERQKGHTFLNSTQLYYVLRSPHGNAMKFGHLEGEQPNPSYIWGNLTKKTHGS